MSDFSEADLATVDRGGVLENDYSMDAQGAGGGCPPGEECLPDTYIDPADCPTCGGDYVPVCINETADDPDTVILALSPFAYYPMDDASGLLQDASGNGNHADTTSGTVTYAQAPITSKVGNCVRFQGGRFSIPKPQASLAGNSAYSFVWLMHIVQFQFTGSPAQACPLVGVSDSGNSEVLAILNTGAGDLYTIFDQAGAAQYASYAPEADLIGRAAVIALCCTGNNQPVLYIDGMRWGAVQTGGTGSANPLLIGAILDGFWGFADLYMSNFASWQVGLTWAEVLAITEALHDAASAAACFTP